MTRNANLMIGLCSICLTLTLAAAAAAMPVYSRDNAPPTPKLEDLPLKESVSQYGITWTFSEPARVGQFVNGDYYVVGPATVTMIEPKALYGQEVPEDQLDNYDKKQPREKHIRNGSMLNPPPNGDMAYDSGLRSAPHMAFKPELVARVPIAMKAGDILVSTISLKLNEKSSFAYHSSGPRAYRDNCPIKVATVLTCVAGPQPPDAFRPSYGDRGQTIYVARNLRRDLLATLKRPQGAPDPVKFAEIFQKCWLNPGFFGFDQPMENMPHYGQWVGQASGDGGLLLCMDFPPAEKEPLLINFVQVGIDYWGLVKNGHPGWEGWGGHGSGRKLPIVLAGILLGDDQMASPTKTLPKVEFGEDNQTRYGECWTGAKVVFTGHSGISSASGKPPRPVWGPYEHLWPTNWHNDNKANHWQSEGYRRCCSSNCWVGQALTIRLMKAEKLWNHDAFFDYVDRWMAENDADQRHLLAPLAPKGYEHMMPDSATWAHQGYANNEAWVTAMWKSYRTGEGLPPTDGWKTLKPNPDGLVLPKAETVKDAKPPVAIPASAAPKSGAPKAEE